MRLREGKGSAELLKAELYEKCSIPQTAPPELARMRSVTSVGMIERLYDSPRVAWSYMDPI
jgi:hypothetical protein